MKRTKQMPGPAEDVGLESDSSYPSVLSMIAFLIMYWVACFTGLTHSAMVIALEMSSVGASGAKP